MHRNAFAQGIYKRHAFDHRLSTCRPLQIRPYGRNISNSGNYLDLLSREKSTLEFITKIHVAAIRDRPNFTAAFTRICPDNRTGKHHLREIFFGLIIFPQPKAPG